VRCSSHGPLITIAEPPPIHELVISNWRLISASFDTCSLATRSVQTAVRHRLGRIQVVQAATACSSQGSHWKVPSSDWIAEKPRP